MNQSRTLQPLMPKSWDQLHPDLKSLYDGIVAEPKNFVLRMAFADKLFETAGDDFQNGDYRPFQEEWAEFIQKQLSGQKTSEQERLSSYIHGSIRLTCQIPYLFGDYESGVNACSHGYFRIPEPEGYWFHAGRIQAQRDGYYTFAVRNGFVSELTIDLRQLGMVQNIKKLAPITKIWLHRFSLNDSRVPSVVITTHKGVTGFMIEWESIRGKIFQITQADILNDDLGMSMPAMSGLSGRARIGSRPEPMRFFVPMAKYLNSKLQVVGNETQKFYDSISEFLGVDVCEAD